MKKLVSILLALVMVLSMGTIAFAEESTAAADETTEAAAETTEAAAETTEAAEEDAAVPVEDIIALFKQIFANVNLDTIKDVASETIATIENIGGIIASLFGSEDGAPAFSLAEVPAMVMNTFIDGVAKLFGTDRQSIIDKLLEIPFVKQIMGWYGYKPAETTVPATTEAPTEAPETEVPATGAAAGIAAFASLSVAAAAAFVSKKKKA